MSYHYKPEERSLALAAVQRYGMASARRLLVEMMETVPAEESIRTWQKAGVEITEQATQVMEQIAGERKERWQGAADSLRAGLTTLVDDAVEAKNFLGAQQAMTAFGIGFDKVVPKPEGGGPLIGNVERAVIVFAPASIDGPA